MTVIKKFIYRKAKKRRTVHGFFHQPIFSGSGAKNWLDKTKPRRQTVFKQTEAYTSTKLEAMCLMFYEVLK